MKSAEFLNESNESPYRIGWKHGFYPGTDKCPFEPGTEEYREYFRGFEEGEKDGMKDYYDRTGNYPGGSDNQFAQEDD